jgi:heme exporter protein A
MKLIADRVCAERGGRTVFAGLSFTVEAGHSLFLTGRNGAGKTTLIRGIAGLFAFASGRVWADGGSEEQALGEQCHYVGHLNAVKPALTVAENARFWSHFLGGGGQTGAALETFGLAGLEDIPVAYLSAGQKRRLALARLLLAQRRIWLLDEPTVSLDESGQGALAAAVAAHLGTGGLVIAATHQPLGFPHGRELRLPATAGA